ncbi:MAG: AAA family ATPase [Deltaproteobacteria bacterium CG11_big_fil_rev_8_21_14_0_20_49_13]|nr:MAG: AAA family ATPase [Deltaproteobacteria bacterium CG11_big_fil_rev_8_21_14_0_20_49_13]
MEKLLKITLNGKDVYTIPGTTIADILGKSPHKSEFPPIAALANNRLVGLYHDIKLSCTIETLDLTSREGTEVYRRSSLLIFFAALREISPNASVNVGQSIGHGYFLELKNGPITDNFIDSVEKKMRDIVKRDVPLRPIWIPIEIAIDHYKKTGRNDRVMLLKQTRKSEAQVADILKYRGFVYGPIAHRTGLIEHFKLHKYYHGLVLEFPSTNGKFTGRIFDQPKLFKAYLETRKWNELINIQNVAQLNQTCISGAAPDLVQVAEALHEKKIAAIADDIHNRKDVRLVLIAGPSSSGKTTFTKRLAVQLRVNGIEPVAISIDNYYLDRKDSPRRPDGTYDFESIDAIDLKLFNKHVKELLAGKEVATPVYSFNAGKRDSNRKHLMRLKPNQVLITEGLHGLNEKLSSEISKKNKVKIYVSALTQLCIDDHNRILTSDARLLRRVVRDRLFRGSAAADTLAMWPQVRAGENMNIFPFQEDADIMFNSTLVYEPALLKTFAERLLMEVPSDHPSYVEALRLFRFLDLLIPILPQEVPQTSILREFIGGSAFRY